MKIIIAIITSMIIYSIGVAAADSISKEQVKKLGLTKIGTINQSDTDESVTSPMDLNRALSKKADSIGGRYYVIIATREHGPNFEAVADVYK